MRKFTSMNLSTISPLWFSLTLGPSVVEKVVDSRYRYTTDTDLADEIGSRWPSQHQVVRY
jgi:hypothetical protein